MFLIIHNVFLISDDAVLFYSERLVLSEVECKHKCLNCHKYSIDASRFIGTCHPPYPSIPCYKQAFYVINWF